MNTFQQSDKKTITLSTVIILESNGILIVVCEFVTLSVSEKRKIQYKTRDYIQITNKRRGGEQN